MVLRDVTPDAFSSSQYWPKVQFPILLYSMKERCTLPARLACIGKAASLSRGRPRQLPRAHILAGWGRWYDSGFG